jgi:hypothetical protein
VLEGCYNVFERSLVSKPKTEGGLDNVDNREAEQFIASKFPTLSTEELFRLAANLEIRPAKPREGPWPDTVFYSRVE